VSIGTVLTSVKWDSSDSYSQVAQYWQQVTSGTVLTSVKWHSTDSECKVAQS